MRLNQTGDRYSILFRRILNCLRLTTSWELIQSLGHGMEYHLYPISFPCHYHYGVTEPLSLDLNFACPHRHRPSPGNNEPTSNAGTYCYVYVLSFNTLQLNYSSDYFINPIIHHKYLSIKIILTILNGYMKLEHDTVNIKR